MVALFWLFIFIWIPWWLIQRGRKRRRAVVEANMAFDPADTFDHAHFKSDEELEAAGCFKPGPTVVGYTDSGKEIYYNPDPGKLKPVIVFSGMGGGKTTSVHIPFAQRWRGSLIVLEGTGETAMVTAHHRKTFQPVTQINPTHAYSKYLEGIPYRRYNPMAPYWFDPKDGDTFGTRADRLAAAIAPFEKSRDPYWDNTSRGLFKTLCMTVAVLEPKKAHLGYVADIIARGPLPYFKWAYEKLSAGKLKDRVARYVSVDDVKSIQEVIQNTITHIDFLMEEPIDACLRAPETIFGNTRTQAQTIFIVNSMETLKVSRKFRALLLECLLAELMNERLLGSSVPVAILVDELKQYGFLECVAEAMSSLRKFNAFMNICINDYGSFKGLYGDEVETFIGNAGCVYWIGGAKDKSGSEYLSAYMGEREVITESKSVSWGAGLNYDKPGRLAIKRLGPSVQNNFKQQRLMLPHEVRDLAGTGKEIVFMDGVKGPILANMRPYYKVPELRRKARRNPYAGK